MRSYSPGHIDCLISHDSFVWRFTGFYGNPCAQLRKHSWDLLRKLNALPLVGHDAWLVGGDFNEIFYASEKKGGEARLFAQLNGFRDVMNEVDLSEILAKGPRYTWMNKRRGRNLILEKLDRYVANNTWRNLYPNVEVWNLEFYHSDHRPIKLLLNRSLIVPKQPHSSTFRFEAKWLLEESYEDTVKTTWSSVGSVVPLQHKLLVSGQSLKTWAKETVGHTKNKILNVRRQLNEKLDEAETRWDQLEVTKLERELEKLYTQEELFWQQRSRTQWLKAGDRNTKYFHASASMRKKKNTISGLQANDGSWNTEVSSMAQIVTDFYTNLFSTQNPSDREISIVTEAVVPCVTDEMNAGLSAPFTVEEVKRATFDLSPTKAPGPDGFPAMFYQKSWDVVQDDVNRQVLDVLNGGCSMEVWNKTVITLIPKVRDPKLMKDFRPISLCNVSYKIIARAITNRFRGVMAQIIDPTQSAFIPGRLITDNVLIGYECMHWLRHSKNRTGFAALKLDMSKAYDRIEWRYLECLMRRMGFSEQWIGLILRCVDSVTYSFKINDAILGSVRPTRGLRQGDPLSPYLFVLCAQGLSSLITRSVRENFIRGICIARGAPIVSHLFFADDNLVFFKATQSDCENLKNCLVQYERASGQMINYDKSAITFSTNTPSPVKESIRLHLNMSVCQGHDVYLGLPTFSLRSKRIQFGYLRDRVAKKIDGWASKHFSEGGREVLIKSVLQAVPSYAMTCFRIPGSICEDIERLCCDFWWGTKDGGKKIHWCSWDDLSRPKIEGGLGFKKITLFNKALLAKQLWRIISDPTSFVGRLFKARYFKHLDALDAAVGSSSSYVWRSLCWSKDLLEAGLRWNIKNGASVRVFRDAWVTGLDGGRISSRIASGSAVSRFITADGAWNEELVQQAFLPYEVSAIYNTPILPSLQADFRFWFPENKGRYTVTSGYKTYWRQKQANTDMPSSSNTLQDGNWWSRIWGLVLPPKVKIFLWKMTRNFVATEANLVRHHVPCLSQCFMCGFPDADTLHVFFYCPAIRGIWKHHLLWCHIKKLCALSIRELLTWIVDSRIIPLEEVAMLCWGYWRERCDIKHGKSKAGVTDISAGWALRYYHNHTAMMATISEISDVPSSRFSRWDRRAAFTGNILKVDAGYDEVRSLFSVGAVVYNKDLVIKAAFGEPIRHPGSILAAELHAIRLGLQRYKDYFTGEVSIYTDSQDAMHAIRSKDEYLGPAGAALALTREVLETVQVKGVSYVPRAQNQVAHCVAKFVSSSSVPHAWFETGIPFWVEDLIQQELL